MSKISATSRLLRVAPLVLAALLWCAGGLGQVIQQFPTADPPGSIALGSDGNLWMTTFGGIGRMTPAGAFTLFPVTAPAQITSGPDGNLWFTKGLDPRIGRITTSGVVTEFATPTSNIWPFATIAAGPDGNVWFTGGYPGLGRITPTGAITEFPVPDAYALVAGADGNLWAAGFGTLKRITPGGSTTAFSIPTATENGFSLDMAAAPDGSIWIADYNNLQIVRFALERPPVWRTLRPSVSTTGDSA